MEFDLKIEDSELINYIKKLLIMAMLFFIATTIIGMINALDFADDYLGRGILLFHLHSGTIAWISTGVSAALIWAYTKERTISSHFKNQISRFYKFWQMIIPSYCLIILISFQLETYFVLPIFGFLTVLGFIWAAYLAFIERNNISNFGVPHISFIIGLAIAGYAGFIGTLLGLQYSLKLIFIPGDGIVSHAGAMEIGYIFLIFTGICELFLKLFLINSVADLEVTSTLKSVLESRCRETILPNIPFAPKTKTLKLLINFRRVVSPRVPKF